MQFVTLIGLLAGTLTTIAFLPQVIKTWKSRSAQDISLQMFLLFCTGVFLWLVYGLLKQDLPVIVANCATLFLAGSILWMKLHFSRQSAKAQRKRRRR